jgi:cyanate permease
VAPRLSVHESNVRLAWPHLFGLVRDPLAWQMTAYFGLISALAYAVFVQTSLGLGSLFFQTAVNTA